jgi:ceramide glucosyltransferase
VDITGLLQLLLALLVAGGCIYTVFAIFAVHEFFTKRNGDKAAIPSVPVSVLKPLKGKDPALRENILRFCSQDYPDYEVLLGVTEPDDEALPVAEEIAASQKKGKVRVIVSTDRPGPNLKVSNMQGLEKAAMHPLLAVSDSDMRVDKDYLATIVREFLRHENTGLVTCLYKIPAPESLGAALESLAVALDFIPSVLVARRLEGVTFGLGASLLVSKKTIDEMGGFSDVADYLADDYQVGNRIWKKGYRIVLSQYVLEDVVGKMSVSGHMLHQLRWARTYRASRPKGYLGYGITHVLPLSLLFLVLHGPAVSSLSLVGAVLLLRFLLAFAIYGKVIRNKEWLKWLAIVPLRDVASFLIWCWSFSGRKVYWRGRYFKVLKGGKIASEG